MPESGQLGPFAVAAKISGELRFAPSRRAEAMAERYDKGVSELSTPKPP
jgi:hypothetical protein